MRLITEQIDDDLEVIIESTKAGKKYAIEGIFAQSETKNRNGRVYPKGIMENAINKYVKEYVEPKRAVGELDHPSGPAINLNKVSHLITDMKWHGNDVVGKASILDTPSGRTVKGLLDGGVKLGVSTRGMGSLDNRAGCTYVKEDYMLNTVDIVQDPSAPTAFVNGIMEGVSWVWHNGILEAQELERIETEIRTAGRTYSYDVQIREFKNFLSKLKNTI